MPAMMARALAVLPLESSTALSVLSNTVEPGVAVPRHFHEYEEVILVEAGQVWVELDKVRLTASPGQSVIIPPHTPHAWGTTGPGTARVLFIWPVLEPFAPTVPGYFLYFPSRAQRSPALRLASGDLRCEAAR